MATVPLRSGSVHLLILADQNLNPLTFERAAFGRPFFVLLALLESFMSEAPDTPQKLTLTSGAGGPVLIATGLFALFLIVYFVAPALVAGQESTSG